MNLYEIMYIVSPDFEGEALEEAIAKVNEVVEKDGSKVKLLKKIGRRKLAYDIEDYKEGYYVLLNVQATPALVTDLEHFFRVTEGYLRYIVLKLDEAKQKEKDAVVPEKEENSGAGEAAPAEE